MVKNKKIAFQGFHGAYSDMSCRAVYPSCDTLPCPSFEQAFQAVKRCDADLAMIPVDNTLAGRVADVHHLLPNHDLFIIGEHFQPIRHALLGVKGSRIEDLEHVHSHVHAIPQCKKLIKSLGLKPHVAADTAGAAQDVKEKGDKTHAAIASPLAAQIYGLEILKENVQDAAHNTTRFLIFSPDPDVPPLEPGRACLTSLYFELRNIPAALYKAMGGFATNSLSMAKLESYVDPAFTVACFYAEIEGHQDSPAMKRALEELAFFAREVKIFGTYPAHVFRSPKD